MSDRPPAEVGALIAERSAARVAGDYARADALRAQVRELGWELSDGPQGTTARPALPEANAGDVAYARAQDLASVLDRPAEAEVGWLVVADDHPADLARFLVGLPRIPGGPSSEIAVVANAPAFDLPALLAQAAPDEAPVVVATTARLGWADAVNLGLRRSRAEVTVLVDTSIEPVGDVLAPLLHAFDDPAVGLAGPFGVTSRDLRQFEEAPPGEVDAIEAYCLAVRRAVLREVGLFDRHFRFYRNADLDFSFAARAAGWRAMRVDPAGWTRHEHRGWASLPADERDRQSRRNFYRFLKRWGSRRDLLLHPG